MQTYKELLNYGRKELRENQIDNGDYDAWLLLEYVCGINRTWYFVHEDEQVCEEQVNVYTEMIGKRKKHVPLQQLTHEAYFYGMKFYVNENVLIPRQDTEVLVEEVLKDAGKKENLQILDMCTGSGCILLSLLANLNNASGTGVDLSHKALEVAQQNGQELKIEASWIESNLFDKVLGEYDIIVSNPPYIETAVIEGLMEEVRIHEPRMALDGLEDGLYFYRRITEEAGKYLKPNGLLAFEIGYNQGEAVSRLMKENHYSDIRVVKDLSGLDRAVLGKRNQEENHV